MKTHLLTITIVGGLLVVAGQGVLGDQEGRGADVAPVTNDLYREECGACHFAYQPGLLPERSWRRLLVGLDDHFGDNAELLPEEGRAIIDYLVSNAADTSGHKRSVRIMSSLQSQDTPLRITETPYIQHKHRKLPARAIVENPWIKSLSACNSCHTRADKGDFDDDEVEIPGLGRWED